MGAGKHGGFGRTKGYSGFVSGDASFMGASEQFLKNIRKRKKPYLQTSADNDIMVVVH